MEGLEDGSWDIEDGEALPAPEDESPKAPPAPDLPSSICHIQFTYLPHASPDSHLLSPISYIQTLVVTPYRQTSSPLC